MRNAPLLLLVLLIPALIVLPGCTRKPNPQELTQLEDARQAADAAEKKLEELRAERTRLESTLEAKKEELRKAEEERDAVKAKLGN